MPRAAAPDGVKEIKTDLRSVFGSVGFLTTAQIAEYLGYNESTARKYVNRKGLVPMDNRKKGRRYYIDDVATAIYESRIAKPIATGRRAIYA